MTDPQKVTKENSLNPADKNNRKDADAFKYTKMPVQQAFGCFAQGSGYVQKGWEYSQGDQFKDNGCNGIIACCACGCGGTAVGCVHVLTGTPFGLFVDLGRYTKRKCDADKNKALHNETVSPTPQSMT